MRRGEQLVVVAQSMARGWARARASAWRTEPLLRRLHREAASALLAQRGSSDWDAVPFAARAEGSQLGGVPLGGRGSLHRGGGDLGERGSRPAGSRQVGGPVGAPDLAKRRLSSCRWEK